MSQEPEVQEEPGDERVKPWASLAHRDFRYMWAGALSASIARQMRQVINLYFIYELTDSAYMLGLVGLFQVIPTMAFGLFGGVIADVFDRRKLLLIAQVGGMIPAIGLAVLVHTDTIEVWHIFAFTAMSAAMNILEGPARTAYLPRLVPSHHLMNAVTLNSSVFELSVLIGPIFGGILIDYIDMGNVYVVNAVLFTPTLFFFSMIKASGKPLGEARSVSFKAIFEGMQFIWFQRILLGLFLVDFGLVIVGFYRPILTILASDVFRVGGTGLGILFAAPAIGSFMGFVTLLWVGDVKRKGSLFLVSVMGYAFGLIFLGLAPWFWLALIAAWTLGYTDSISVVIRQTLTQLLAPDEVRGRAASFANLFAGAGNALGSMEAGFVAQAIGAGGTLVFGGIVATVIVSSVGLSWRGLWRYRSPKQQ
jgi:MFS family permease